MCQDHDDVTQQAEQDPQRQPFEEQPPRPREVDRVAGVGSFDVVVVRGERLSTGPELLGLLIDVIIITRSRDAADGEAHEIYQEQRQGVGHLQALQKCFFRLLRRRDEGQHLSERAVSVFPKVPGHPSRW